MGNLVALYKALGGGWQIRMGKELIPEETREVMTQRTNWGELLGTQRDGAQETKEATRARCRVAW